MFQFLHLFIHVVGPHSLTSLEKKMMQVGPSLLLLGLRKRILWARAVIRRLSIPADAHGILTHGIPRIITVPKDARATSV